MAPSRSAEVGVPNWSRGVKFAPSAVSRYLPRLAHAESRGLACQETFAQLKSFYFDERETNPGTPSGAPGVRAVDGRLPARAGQWPGRAAADCAVCSCAQ